MQAGAFKWLSIYYLFCNSDPRCLRAFVSSGFTIKNRVSLGQVVYCYIFQCVFVKINLPLVKRGNKTVGLVRRYHVYNTGAVGFTTGSAPFFTFLFFLSFSFNCNDRTSNASISRGRTISPFLLTTTVSFGTEATTFTSNPPSL